MASQDPVEGRDEQWQQPSFLSEGQPGERPVSGEVVVPGEPAPPPSMVESIARGLAGIVWPVMILLAILNYIGFWPAIIIALVASSVLGAVHQNLRSRRKALPPRAPRRDGDDLR